MSTSPTFTVRQKNDGEEEEWVAIDQGRSHTSSPRSRPKSRLEILLMDVARSQEERARSIDQKIESLARALTEQTRSLLELVRPPAELANIMGRISSVYMAPLVQVRSQVEEVRPLRPKQCTSPCL